MIAPLEFIPLAEETGLINPIGEWVLRKACADAAQWPANVKISVNLSAVQFRQSLCPIDNVRNVLDDTGLPPERLELEITETVLLQGNEENVETLHQLRAMGISIVLDDFGTGYSSLSYLRMFPFDKIKIDRSFVQELAKNEHSASIVSAVAGLGRSLRIGTVAEGMETEDQLVLIRAAGCTHAQGFLFGKPCAMEELTFGRLGHSESCRSRVAGRTAVAPERRAGVLGEPSRLPVPRLDRFGFAVLRRTCWSRAKAAAGGRPSRNFVDRRAKAASLACDGFANPLSLRTNCIAEARISSSVAGGSKLNSVRILRHIVASFRARLRSYRAAASWEKIGPAIDSSRTPRSRAPEADKLRKTGQLLPREMPVRTCPACFKRHPPHAPAMCWRMAPGPE